MTFKAPQGHIRLGRAAGVCGGTVLLLGGCDGKVWPKGTGGGARIVDLNGCIVVKGSLKWESNVAVSVPREVFEEPEVFECCFNSQVLILFPPSTGASATARSPCC